MSRRRRERRRLLSKEDRKNFDLKRKTGLTLDDLRDILGRQQFRCLGCCTQLDEWSAHLDHDHACHPKQSMCKDCLRGVLCMKCNLLLGLAEDNPSVLRNLADYLEDWH
jgi:hypothetical protein